MGNTSSSDPFEAFIEKQNELAKESIREQLKLAKSNHFDNTLPSNFSSKNELEQDYSDTLCRILKRSNEYNLPVPQYLVNQYHSCSSEARNINQTNYRDHKKLHQI